VSDCHLTVSDIIRRSIADTYRRLTTNEAGLRAGDDPEAVHQARVATRRLRSDLRTFDRFLEPRWAADLGADLRWLGSELGTLRDIEVQRDRLQASAARLPTAEAEAARRVIRRLEADRAATRLELMTMLSQARYSHVREHLAAAAVAPALMPAASAAAADVLKPVLRRRWNKIGRTVNALGDNPSDDALHRVRVRAKRCRYAAEACEPAFGKSARRLARAMTGVQNVLGEHHDAVVAGAWLAKTAHECSPAEAYAIGMLAQLEEEAAAAARRAFPAVWHDADTDRVHGWL